MARRRPFPVAILGALLAVLASHARSFASDDPAGRLWKRSLDRCSPGLHRQPDGPFATLLFCEDALGDYLAVVYLEPMGRPAAVPFAAAWKIDDRVWQEGLWAADVTSFAWSPDGKRLYVTTSEVYGSGGLFELDLVSRKARQIAPGDSPVSGSAPGADYVIEGVDERAGFLYYSPGDGEVPLGRSHCAGQAGRV